MQGPKLQTSERVAKETLQCLAAVPGGLEGRALVEPTEADSRCIDKA